MKTYYKDQMKKLNWGKEIIFKLHDDDGNESNWLALNSESVKTLLDLFLSAKDTAHRKLYYAATRTVQAFEDTNPEELEFTDMRRLKRELQK